MTTHEENKEEYKLWVAINMYVDACGGDPRTSEHLDEKIKAAREIMRVIRGIIEREKIL